MLFAASLLHHQPAFWVNTLVIGYSATGIGALEDGPKSDLLRYYEENVIHGAGAFAMVARGYEDYAAEMRSKLMRELRLPVLGLKDC